MPPAASDPRTSYHTCPLCEVTCGLELTIRDGRVLKVRGDRQDVFSHGFLCPKSAALAVARRQPGINVNLLHDDQAFDRCSRNSVLNGLPVYLEPACKECA